MTHRMKNFIFLLTFFSVIGASLWVLMQSDPSDTAEAEAHSNTLSKPVNLELGIVDPDNKFAGRKDIKTDALFVPWASKNYEKTVVRLNALSSDRKLMITVEPWPEKTGDELFLKASSGYYDASITQLCTEFKSLSKTTTIRFAHEMEAPNSVYPWANVSPDEYIALYRHFVDVCKKSFSTASFMWSPNGEKSAPKFYPGKEYVDVIGLSAYGYPEFEQVIYGHNLSFVEMFQRKYNSVADFPEPIYLAEFGVSSTVEYQTEYLQDAFLQMQNQFLFPKLIGVNYFYYYNPSPWIPGITPPDYRFDIKLIRL